nr:MAG: MC149R [Molluscum contagiosum virus]
MASLRPPFVHTMQPFRVLAAFSLESVSKVFTQDLSGAQPIPAADHDGLIPGHEVARYCNVAPLLEQVRKHFHCTERVYPVSNTAKYQVFGVGQSLHSRRDDTRVCARLLVCLKAPSRGGCLVLKPDCHTRTTLTPRVGMAVLVSNLADYDVTAVMGGQMLLAVVELDIPRMRMHVSAQGDLLFSGSSVIFEQPSVRDVCFAFRLVVDEQTKDVVCEQLLHNGELYTVLQIVSSGERVPVRAQDPLALHHDLDFVPHARVSDKDEMLQRLATMMPPYAEAAKQVCVYGSPSYKVCTVYTMYGRLLGANV